MSESTQQDPGRGPSSRWPSQSTPEPTYLYVPFAEKQQARSLGARWDATRRAWFVPPGIPTAPFARWLYLPPIVGQPLYLDLHLRDLNPDELLYVVNAPPPVEAVLMPFICWHCRGDALAFYGLAGQGGFLFTDLLYWPETIEEMNAFAKQHNLVPPGTVKPRFSKSLGGSAVSQGCPRCDSLFGDHFVHRQALDHSMNLPGDYPYRFELLAWPPGSLHDYLRQRGL